MWSVFEHRQLAKSLAKAPKEIVMRYEKWKDIVRMSGPQGLRFIKGLHDESLKGEWAGFRSSRLGLQYRVIYEVVNDEVYVAVFDVTAHDYRRK
ncbi:MAG: type II toxin-antitoxin system mRNA interferase toxin, RelE/StbE family [Deltaproteobacteria bacterium]|nr:type II toxin-antitoxin system mRNA interferase toxin, RelE/StbE family [Deltaproteobacteria bacterium]MBI3294593.1 type II toxin-antitoxin system mRNA interferase toxin, RelE/StbE family [Deltaproteobacteria bacterium]